MRLIIINICYLQYCMITGNDNHYHYVTNNDY